MISNGRKSLALALRSGGTPMYTREVSYGARDHMVHNKKSVETFQFFFCFIILVFDHY